MTRVPETTSRCNITSTLRTLLASRSISDHEIKNLLTRLQQATHSLNLELIKTHKNLTKSLSSVTLAAATDSGKSCKRSTAESSTSTSVADDHGVESTDTTSACSTGCFLSCQSFTSTAVPVPPLLDNTGDAEQWCSNCKPLSQRESRSPTYI